MKILVLHSDIGDDPPPEELDTLIAADAVADVLTRRGHKVGQAPFRQAELKELLALTTPDIVFNLVEGVEGQGRLAPQAPQMLADLSIRFTGVSARAMAVTNDKPLTKSMLREAGLATPGWAVPPDWAGLDGGKWIVKSALEDASLGLDDGCVVAGPKVLARAAACAAKFGGDWFAERYVEGREFNIAVLDGRVLPMAEMRFEQWPAGKPRIVGYDAKWEEDSSGWRGTVRAFGVERNEPALAAKLKSACEQVWKLFALSGFARVDFRVDEDGVPLILEINTNPCISPDAGFAAAAEEAGMDYGDLIEAIVSAGPRSDGQEKCGATKGSEAVFRPAARPKE
ncbi:MAG: D-alanine--D-alanine ligase [Alphaproteobacteria bacterium]|nr:D-alanine--D-alanine ligase [Alphaproteobacteria bacterium]